MGAEISFLPPTKCLKGAKMKYIYPIVITETSDPSGINYLVNLKDFDYMSQGETLAEAIEMGQDLLANVAIMYEDDNREFPEPSDVKTLQLDNPDATVTLVLADSTEYRKAYNTDSVKKTLSIPTWLNSMSEKANINFSQTLQEALKNKLAL
jgi:antitoxin HicB